MSSIKDEILLKEGLLSLPDGSSIVGYAYITNYVPQPTKNGGMFLGGSMNCVGTVPFKVWSGPLYDTMAETSVAGKICRINGKVNEFNSQKSIIFDTCVPYEGDELEVDDFLEHKYNAEEMFAKMHKILVNNCTAEGVEIFDTIINPIKDRFCKEYAAVSHHDACANGLLAHTFKTVRLVQILKFYDALDGAIDKDLLFVSAALHDIGKIREYNTGAITEIGMQMSHLTLGVEMIAPFEQYIVRVKGQNFYNGLISVIQQHHGEYGERPRTLVAYMIHIIDGLEAQLTDINDIVDSAISNQVKIDDYKLSF